MNKITESLETIGNMEIIGRIHSKFLSYQEKRGDSTEAIQIVNADIVASPSEYIFWQGNGVHCSLISIVKDGDNLDGKFEVVLEEDIEEELKEHIETYIEFLDLNYQQKLDVEGVKNFLEKIEKVIACFETSVGRNYKMDLGEDSLFVATARNDVYLSTEEKRTFVKGMLLKIEDQSDMINRISLKGDKYMIYTQEKDEITVEIRGELFIVEADFFTITSLPDILRELDHYLFQPYMERFEYVSMGLKKEEVMEVLSNNDGGGFFGSFFKKKKDNKVETKNLLSQDTDKKFVEIKEDHITSRTGKIVSNPYEKSEEREEKPELDENTEKALEEAAESKTPIMGGQKQVAKALEEVKYGDDDQVRRERYYLFDKYKHLKNISNMAYEAIERQFRALNVYQDAYRSDQWQLLRIMVRKFHILELLSMLGYYKKYLPKQKNEISYLKYIIQKEFDSHSLGFSEYFKIDYHESNKNELKYDMVFKDEDTLYVQPASNTAEERDLNTGRQESRHIAHYKFRKFTKNRKFVLAVDDTSVNQKQSTFTYNLLDASEGNKIWSWRNPTKELDNMILRSKFDYIHNYLFILADGILRVIDTKENRVRNTKEIEQDRFFVSKKIPSVVLYNEDSIRFIDDVTESVQSKKFDVTKILGKGTSIVDMHSDGEIIKIIYHDGYALKCAYYDWENFSKSEVEQTGQLEYDGEKVEKRSRIPCMTYFDMTRLNGINLKKVISSDRLFWSEDGKYAIFEKDSIIYTLRFDNYGVNLFRTYATFPIKKILNVCYHPDNSEVAIWVEDKICKLDLELVESLQMDEKEEEIRALDTERRRVIDIMRKVRFLVESRDAPNYSEVLNKKRWDAFQVLSEEKKKQEIKEDKKPQFTEAQLERIKRKVEKARKKYGASE